MTGEVSIKNKYAWAPKKLTSGKWVWRCCYIKIKMTYTQCAGMPLHVVTVESYTPNDYMLMSLTRDFKREAEEGDHAYYY
jgi:hypothetical protein